MRSDEPSDSDRAICKLHCALRVLQLERLAFQRILQPGDQQKGAKGLTRTPACRQLSMAAATSGRGGSWSPVTPSQTRSVSMRA